MGFKGSDDKGNNLIIQLSGLDYSVQTHGFHCHFKKIGLYCILATIGIHRLFVANMTFFPTFNFGIIESIQEITMTF